MYKKVIGFNGAVRNDAIQRLPDNAFIPFDDANTDFAEYKKWLAEGNEPSPPDEPKD
jgi:hypothetical protein